MEGPSNSVFLPGQLHFAHGWVKHLKVLENAGLISRSREAQTRPAKLEPETLKAVSEWVETYRRFWEQRFDRLDAYLATLQEQETQKKDNGDGGEDD